MDEFEELVLLATVKHSEFFCKTVEHASSNSMLLAVPGGGEAVVRCWAHGLREFAESLRGAMGPLKSTSCSWSLLCHRTNKW